MKLMTRSTETMSVAQALDKAAEYNHRAKTCQPEHRRSLYRKKDRFLLKAMSAAPEQFLVDSVTGSPPIVGVSHSRSGRRFHVPLEIADVEMQRILRELPGWTGADLGDIADSQEGRMQHDKEAKETR